jgi:AcrR family transcriptional regulator
MGRPPIINRSEMLAAARGLFARRGFEATTLAEIAGALSVTPAAVLRHCGSKEKLFVEAMRSGLIELPPFFRQLEQSDVEPDPRVALRRFAEQFVPFVGQRLSETVAVHMHAGARGPLPLPFDPRSRNSPPRRGIPIIEAFLARAVGAGTLRVRDTRAAALLFAGSLQSYAFLHQVLNVFDTPFPLALYLDTLFDVWTEGAVVVRKRKPSPRKAGGSRRGKKARR